MTIQTLILSQIQPSALNPRKYFNDTTIEELARSIKTDGLLQNLVVIKPKGKAKKHSLIAGERRFRALTHLIETGEIAKDFPIAVEIKENLTDDEALRIATVENVQRENLSPLEEATALAALVQNGEFLDDIVAQTGLSIGTIRRRLLLLSLSENVKNTLSEKKITLSQAEAMTVGKLEDQDNILDDVISGRYYTPDDIKECLIGDLPALSIAIFAGDEYTGDYTTDLLADAESTYFNDIEQFFTLQKQAAEKLVAEYAETHDWARLEEGYSFHKWEYGEAEAGETGGVVVFLKRSGVVEVHGGLIKGKANKATTAALSGRSKDTYPAPLRRYMGLHKSLAVQAALIANLRKAKELAVCRKLASFKPHACLSAFESDEVMPPALTFINLDAAMFLSDLAIPINPEQSAWRTLIEHFDRDAEAVYDAIQSLPDENLDALLLFLEVCEFGQLSVDRHDTDENSLFNKLAKDLNVDMREYWRPDEAFLKRRNKMQLQVLMNETGAAASFGSAADYKKGDLAKRLTKFFQNAKNAKSPTENDVSVNAWLPEAMAFPAVDPDHIEADPEEDYEDESF